MKLTILEHGFQRNGVAGEPFYIFRAQLDPTVGHPDGEIVLITIGFAESTDRGDRLDGATCRVVKADELSAGYRGDRLSDSLFKAMRDSGFDKEHCIDLGRDL